MAVVDVGAHVHVDVDVVDVVVHVHVAVEVEIGFVRTAVEIDQIAIEMMGEEGREGGNVFLSAQNH